MISLKNYIVDNAISLLKTLQWCPNALTRKSKFLTMACKSLYDQVSFSPYLESFPPPSLPALMGNKIKNHFILKCHSF